MKPEEIKKRLHAEIESGEIVLGKHLQDEWLRKIDSAYPYIYDFDVPDRGKARVSLSIFRVGEVKFYHKPSNSLVVEFPRALAHYKPRIIDFIWLLYFENAPEKFIPLVFNLAPISPMSDNKLDDCLACLCDKE